MKTGAVVKYKESNRPSFNADYSSSDKQSYAFD